MNRLALIHDRELLVDFVLHLPSVHDDLTGMSTGIPRGAVPDETWARNAAVLIGGTDSLTERVDLAVRLPETKSGARNKLYTYLYAELADELNAVLNKNLDNPSDPTAPGFTGLNWPHFGASASNSVLAVIDQTLDPTGPFGVNDATAQQAADGNQFIFGTLAPALAQPLTLFIGGDEQFDTELTARVQLGRHGRVFDVTRDLERMGLPNNLIDELDLVGDLDAAVAIEKVLQVRDFTVSLVGEEADLSIEPIHGVASPAPDSPRAPFPVSAAQWARDGGNETIIAAGTVIHEEDFTAPGKIEGSGVAKWTDDEARMFYIAHWFREQHTDPLVMNSISECTPNIMVPWLPE